MLGLVHRDVSPHNVLVTFAGDVKLVDFGIARLVHETLGQGTRGPGGGKYAYMSPEQASGGAIDHRSDLVSAGIVLWELLVGRRLFQDPDPEAKLQKVIEAQVPDPAEHGVPIDEGLREVLGRRSRRRHALARTVDLQLQVHAAVGAPRPWLRRLRGRDLAGLQDLQQGRGEAIRVRLRGRGHRAILT